MFNTHIEKKVLSKLDDFAYALHASETENYAQSVCELLSCWGCYLIMKGSAGTYHFYNSESEVLRQATGGLHEDIRGLYERELPAKSSGETEVTVFNQDPVYLKLSASFKKKFQSVSVNLVYDNNELGILSCIFKKNTPFAVVNHGFYLAAKLLASHAYSLLLKARITDLEIANKKERDIARTTLDTTGNATVLIEEDTTISYVNHEFELLSGYSKEELEDRKSFTEFVAKEDLERMMEYHRFRRIKSHKAPRNYEFTFIDKNKNFKYIYMTIDMVPDTTLSIGSFMNITERKRLESEIINISEMERQQVGRDLHDGLGPHLLGIKFMLNTMKQHVQKKQMPAIEDVQVVYDSLSEAIDLTRRMMKGMRPVIQAEDFIHSIKDMVVNVEKLFNIQCNLKNNSFRISENIVATHLYYIAQEAINNAVKHGDAELIDVIFIYKDDSLFLDITDNGVGVPKLPDVKKGMGINIMRYRANILKSKLEIKRRPEGGTGVHMVLTAHPSIKSE